jgi:MinD superfamily P-loop ATPase
MAQTSNVFKLAVASGKGGTGKTLLSTNLASFVSEFDDVLLVDLDVEEPNDSIFVKGLVSDVYPQFKMVPQWDVTRCDLCGDCVDICNFNALVKVGKMIVVYENLCHSCHACSELCHKNALPMKKHHVGDVSVIKSQNLTLLEGRLNVNEEQPVALINNEHSLVNQNWSKYNYQIFDSPPGTSCSMVASTGKCDYILLVTEPTPFGLNDLKLAVDAAKLMKRPFGVVINKYGSGNKDVEEYCRDNGIEVLGKIPFDISIAERYSKGELLLDKHCFRSVVSSLYNKLENIRISQNG